MLFSDLDFGLEVSLIPCFNFKKEHISNLQKTCGELETNGVIMYHRQKIG